MKMFIDINKFLLIYIIMCTSDKFSGLQTSFQLVPSFGSTSWCYDIVIQVIFMTPKSRQVLPWQDFSKKVPRKDLLQIIIYCIHHFTLSEGFNASTWAKEILCDFISHGSFLSEPHLCFEPALSISTATVQYKQFVMHLQAAQS